MNVKIFYEYTPGSDCPYRAMCWVEEKKFVCVSAHSFLVAENSLTTCLPSWLRAAGLVPAMPVDVPEPKEVEVAL